MICQHHRMAMDPKIKITFNFQVRDTHCPNECAAFCLAYCGTLGK